MHHPPSVAPHHRYRAENHHRQPRSGSELAAASISCNMAPSDSSSDPCLITQRRPPVHPASCDAAAEEERAPPEAGTSSNNKSPDNQAAAWPAGEEPASLEAEKKKQDSSSRAAEEDAAAGAGAGGGGGGGCFLGAEPARRPEESARERLKRHRTEMAGRVRIPDMWGQERLLKDWVDCAVFDRPLAATAGLLNARDALVAECAAARRSAGRPLRVQNSCS